MNKDYAHSMQDDTISRWEALENCKVGFLNTNVQSPTEIQTLIDHTFAKGWNACNIKVALCATEKRGVRMGDKTCMS